MYFPLFVGVLCLYLFCYALLCVHSSFAIILKRKRKLVALLLLSYRCFAIIDLQMYCYYKCSVTLPHGTVGWSAVCDCVFPDHTHLLLEIPILYSKLQVDHKILTISCLMVNCL